jgi:4-amino-4-deoxy-L-arabinose transferase-like glycosyltransferase
VLACAVAASLAAVWWSWTNGALLNYGDAVAHMHIARRVFDSHQPRLSQLGSVWLPLPHILMLPFVQVYAWWANGVAGIVPSALAYVASCVGLYKLARRWMSAAPAAIATAFFALNPNLLYLQSTAMTEPLFLCLMVWIALWLVEWREALDTDAERARRLLIWIAAGLVAAIFTRYDGWIMTALAWTGIGVELLLRRRLRQWTYWLLTAVLIAAPIAWFVYNQMAFGDWLEFSRGPYSAKTIELHTMSHGDGPPHPGWHNMFVSAIFFLKAAEMDAIALAWGNFLLVSSLVVSIGAWLLRRKHGIGWALQLLWLPAPFYAYSVAYGSVPIFLPVWWPHSFYNTRYGMELLPALALGVGFVAMLFIALAREFKPQGAKYATALLALLVVANTSRLIHDRPITYVEGTKNMEAHRPYQLAIPSVLRQYLQTQPAATVLMETSVDPEIVALTGIPLRQTINEADLAIWDTALKSPASHAALVLAFEGDAVDRAVQLHPENLTAVAHFAAKGQPSGTLYVSTVQTASTTAPAR